MVRICGTYSLKMCQMGMSPQCYYVSNRLMYCSAIGLGPPNPGLLLYTETEVPTILQRILSEDVLETTIVVLSLPSEPGSPGSLTLGALPDDSGNEIVRLPLGDSRKSSLRDTWHLEIDSVSIPGNVTLDFTNTFARLELIEDFIFPHNVTMALLKSIGADWSSGLYLPLFNCSRWDDLPDIVFTFSKIEVVLTKEDYGFHILKGPKKICGVHFFEAYYYDDLVVLGTRFMRKFHVVFDVDAYELARRSHPLSLG